MSPRCLPSFRIHSFALILVLFAALPAMSRDEEPPLDIEEAMALCDRRPLQPVEGLWEFPSENMVVAVLREDRREGDHTPPRYMVTVVETPDVSLSPGDTIGWLRPAGDVRKFEMQLFTRRGPSTLMRPARLLAELSSDENSVRLKAEKWKVKIGSLPFMRSLWRLVKIQHDDPLRNSEPPMVRIYPSASGLPGRESEIRYL